ncbi:LysR family transcriptional regulator [Archangium lansingense]|uniref:LysR substrate-binding domain-containing protein n=1 Tax=Archangium lansingense TaxID=2995310 RepID=A0ABT4A0C1_9BACT|nr:LysR family transcriptional regulator [Archangium lansinium]MCY1075104.1 LysR substrate-binding domain-containing protein [Archangium lansinium]
MSNDDEANNGLRICNRVAGNPLNDLQPMVENHSMESLSHLESFVRSAETGSFSAAARRLGLTPAAVSKNVATLEARLGVRLFQRSTRRLTLTESGERFLQEVRGGLETIQGAIANVATAAGQPSGTLKVSMSPAFGLDYVLPLLQEFLTLHPAVLPDWQFDNRQVDLIADGFDAAIGGGIELTPGVVARELARAHIIAVASPAYLSGKKRPRSPAELASFNGIVMRSPQSGRIRSWVMRTAAGDPFTVELKPRVVLNDPEAICRAAVMGLGVALVVMPHALPYLESGALVRLLPDWYTDAGPISLYFPSQKLLPAKTRAFVDFIVARFQQQRLAKRFSAV